MKTTSFIIVIFILLIVFWPSKPAQPGRDSPQTTRIQSSPRTRESRLEQTRTTRIIRKKTKTLKEENEIDPYEDWELSKILSHFMVPPDEFKAGSIHNSISRLKEIYFEHSGHHLEISLEAPLYLNKGISFQHDNISFRSLLGMVAGLSGYSASITPDEIIFSTIKSAPARSAVSPSHPLALSEEAFQEILTTPEKTREYLKSHGLNTPDDFEFPKDPNALAHLITSLQEARLDPENTPKMSRVANKFVTLPPGTEFEATSMTTPELQVAMREWSQMKGVDFMNAPPLVGLPGQDGTIAIGKEVIYQDAQNPDQFLAEFVGLRIKAKPILAGLDQVQMSAEVNFSTVDTEDPQQLHQESFQSNISESEIHLYDGGNVLIPITGEDGTPMVQVITFERVDATGKRFWPPSPE